MNPVDIVITVLIVYAAIRGFMKGVIKEVAGIVGVLVGIWASVLFSEYTEGFIEGAFGASGGLIKPSAFIITFIIALVLVKILAGIIDKLLSTIGLSFLVKISGLVVAILKMMLIVGTFLIVLLNINKKLEESFIDTEDIENSKLAQPAMDMAQIIIPQDIFDINFNKEVQQ